MKQKRRISKQGNFGLPKKEKKKTKKKTKEEMTRPKKKKILTRKLKKTHPSKKSKVLIEGRGRIYCFKKWDSLTQP